ncbi:hypothetical protein D3C77_519990 [compost metagenome]
MQCGAHEVHPDGQRDGAAVLPAAEAFRLVEAGPDRGDVVAVIAAEPGVLGVIGGAGLAGQVVAFQRQRTATGAADDHVLQHAVENVGGARIDDLFGRRSAGLRRGRHRQGRHTAFAFRYGVLRGRGAGRPSGIGGEQDFAVTAFNTLDHVGLDLVAAIGENAPAAGNFQRGERGGAQRQGQVAGHRLGVEAEATEVLQGVLHADVLQQSDRYQVA